MTTPITLEDLLATLQAIGMGWEQRAREAASQTEKLRLQSVHEAYYHRGLSDGLKIALQELQTALNPSSADEQPQPVPEQTYVIVDRDTTLAVLKRAGLLIADLQEHSDHTFSAFFAPLQVTPFDDRINRLSSAADVEILDYGKLPNSSKTYLDFGFKSQPER